MGIRQALSSAFSRFARRPQKTAHGLDAETLAKGYYGLIRSALRASVPGGWASDHYEETLHYTGWNYVAGHATALQCAGAEVEVSRPINDDVKDAWSGKAIRKAFPRSAMHSGRERYFQAIATGRLSKSHDQGPSEDRDILPEDFGLCKLLNRPNESQSGAHLRYEISVQLSQTGTALIVKVPNRLGKTVELYTVPTCLMTPRPASSQYPRGAYYVSPAATRTNWADDSFITMVGYQRLAGTTIDMRDLLKISIPHPLWKDEGYSPLAAGALWSDASEQIDRARFSQFLNEARPSLIVKPPENTNPTDNEIERVVQLMAALYAGTVNRGKIMVAPGGCEIEQANVLPKDMDYSSGFTQFRDAIMGLHGVPLIAAGITDGGSYAAFYAALKQFIMLCVQPRLDWIAEELTYQLAPEYGYGLMVRLLAASIDDPAVLESRLATDINGGWIRKDEARALRGLSPVGAEQGGDDWAGRQNSNVNTTNAAEIAGGTKPGDEHSTGISTGLTRPENAAGHFAAAVDAGNPQIGEKMLKALDALTDKVAAIANVQHTTTHNESAHVGMYINGDIPESLRKRLDSTDKTLADIGALLAKRGDWDESKHPRGQPGNAGEFGPGGGGTATQQRKPKPKPKPSKKPPTLEDLSGQKKALALKTYKPSTKAKQDHAEANEHIVSEALGADKSPDNKPMDVTIAVKGKVKHGVELKTMLDNSNDKITMHPPSRKRKEDWAKQTGATIHTVVLDHRDKFNGGKNKKQYSGHEIYYRRGVGAFRVGTMYKAKDWNEVKRLMSMPADKLPKGAA